MQEVIKSGSWSKLWSRILYSLEYTLGLDAKKKIRYLILLSLPAVPEFRLVTLKLLNVSGGAKDPPYSGFLEFVFSEHL